MASQYTIYQVDGVTPVANLPQPVASLLELVPRGTYADGRERVALKRKLTWTFPDLAQGGLSEADYLILTGARPSDGKVKIATWWPAEGVVASHWADCTAIWSPLPTVSNFRGRYSNVQLFFTEVLHL